MTITPEHIERSVDHWLSKYATPKQHEEMREEVLAKARGIAARVAKGRYYSGPCE